MKKTLSPVESENVELKIRIAFLEEEVRRRDLEIDALMRRRAAPLKLDPRAKDAFRRPARLR